MVTYSELGKGTELFEDGNRTRESTGINHPHYRGDIE